MKQLVDDLLLAARAGAADRRTRFADVRVGLLFLALADEFAGLASDKGIAFGQRSDPDLVVRCDPEGMERIVRNLLSNALKFTPRGGQVELSAELSGSRCTIRVADSGPGVAPEERDRIFHRFHRAVKTPNGTGLGLAIVRALVEAHGGRIRVDDRPGGGAVFAVELPGARGVAPSDDQESIRALVPQ
jgi:signal transduction histidine kinase